MASRLVPFAAAALTCLPAGKLSTDYTRDRRVAVEIQTSLEMETTSLSMERDGEPVDSPFGSGMTSSTSQELAWTDKVLEHEDGKPNKLQRVFGDLRQTSSFSAGDQEDSRDQDSPLASVTLELTRDGDDVEVKVTDGSADGDVLKNQRLELLLDGLLPEGAKDDGDSWEIEPEVVQRTLLLDLGRSLFPPPEASDGGGEGGGRRRGRGGFGRGGSMALQSVEWEGKATLEGDSEEHDGASCRVIKVEFEGEGQVEEPSWGGGRGRAFGLEPASFFETTVTAKLEGRLLFDENLRLPVYFELAGKVEIHSLREGEFQGGSFKSESTQEGTLRIEATTWVATE